MANIKLKDNNWEASGIYDLDQQKNQRQINAEVHDLKSALNPLGLFSQSFVSTSSGYQWFPITIEAGKYIATGTDMGTFAQFVDSNKNTIAGAPSIPKTANNFEFTLTSEVASQIAYIVLYLGSLKIWKAENVLTYIEDLETKTDEIKTTVGTLLYTDNETINRLIADCKVEITNNSIKSIEIEIPQNVNNYLNIKTYNASNEQIASKTCALIVYYDSVSKLFLCDTDDFRIRMIIDLSNLSASHSAYVAKYSDIAYKESYLFDIDNYPYNKHLSRAKLKPTNSGNPLSKYMEMREAFVDIYINSIDADTIDMVNNELRLKNGSTIIATKAITSNYVGPVLFNNYCGMYIDGTKLTGTGYPEASLTKTESEYNPIMAQPKVFYCGANRKIKTLKEGIETATKYMDSILYVDSGVYNLIEEFGSEYFANLPATDEQAGLKLKNRIHIIFSANSIVLSHYTGDNENVCTCFSPFNIGDYGATLENLMLFSSRTRYGVHDVGAKYSKYINCHIEQDNSQNEYWTPQCAIASGLGRGQSTTIERCYFKGRVYWHLTSEQGTITDHRCIVSCTDSYFNDDTLMVETSRNDATYDTDFIFTGNSLLKVSASDNYGIIRYITGATHLNICAWNNEVRNS